MEVKYFIDKLEDFVYRGTSDIEELEVTMVAISKELSCRYLSKVSISNDVKNKNPVLSLRRETDSI